jgi:Fe-Mn family superoxide dismutase
MTIILMAVVKYFLPNLPYEYDALEPVISKEIMQLHHDKHHLAYVNGTNAALELLEKARKGETEVNIKAVMRDLSFNLNGHLLHEVFWQNMRAAKDENMPGDDLKVLLDSNFGSFEAFKKEFSDAAKSVEGSGWVVLAKDKEKNLFVFQLEKHNLLGINGFIPVLVNDVWEHAYYLDYKNDRAAYVDAWWKIVNWEDVAQRIS